MVTLLGGVMWLLAQPAPSQRLRLSYEAVASCPDRATVKSRVRAEVGADVFDETSPRGVSLTVREAKPPGRGLLGEIEFRDEAGQPDGWRRLESPRGDCDELIRGFALLAALHLQWLNKTQAAEPAPARADDVTAPVARNAPPTRSPGAPARVARRAQAAPETPAPPAPQPPGASRSEASLDAATPPPASEGVRAQWSTGAGLLGHAGVSPDLVPGVRAELLMRRPRWAMGAGIDLLSLGGSAGGTFAFTGSAALGWLSPCAGAASHRLRADVCPFVALGFVSVRGEGVDRPRRAWGLLVHTGLDVRLSLAIASPWSLSVLAGPGLDPAPWSVAVDGVDRWRAPAWSVRAALLLHRAL